jgi:hypothetical protein
MRRTLLIAPLAGLAALTAVLVLVNARSSPAVQNGTERAQQDQSEEALRLKRIDEEKRKADEIQQRLQAEKAARAQADRSGSADRLPIGQVVLYSSGVGYFQREGTLDGTQRIDLSFPVQDVNDLLKSMVLRDLDGGTVSTVSYDSNAPVEKTLRSFAINLTGNPSLARILTQARGEKVEVVLQTTTGTQPGTLTGTVIGLERQRVAAGKDTIEVEVLNLWCADGMRALKMSEVARVRFLNPVLDSEFKKALETLALSHDTQKKAVSLHFVGEGKRRVRVGYVVENPIWKTSYRLVLDKKGKPFLQGWAVVENPTDEDWKGVRMALVSGVPSPSRWTCISPSTSQGPWSSPSCSPPCGPSPTAAI